MTPRNQRTVAVLMLTALVILLGVGTSVGASPGPRPGGLADLYLTEGDSRDPQFGFDSLFYGYRIENLGPDTAIGVELVNTLPELTSFSAIEVANVPEGVTVECDTPSVGQAGTVRCSIDALPSGAEVRINLLVAVSASPGSIVDNVATVSSITADPDTSNDVVSFSNRVPFPPIVDSVKAKSGDGAPFRLVIKGSNFKEYFPEAIQVSIGADFFPWTDIRVKSETTLIVTGGRQLKALFPKGVPTQIVIFNGGDGGSAVTSFTR